LDLNWNLLHRALQKITDPARRMVLDSPRFDLGAGFENRTAHIALKSAKRVRKPHGIDVFEPFRLTKTSKKQDFNPATPQILNRINSLTAKIRQVYSSCIPAIL
jgi:hypothetical protein